MADHAICRVFGAPLGAPRQPPGALGRLAEAIGEAGGNIGALDGFEAKDDFLDEDTRRRLHRRGAHDPWCAGAVEGLDGVEVLEAGDRTFEMHEGGKIEVLARMPVRDRDDLSMAYTPGVARVCKAIEAEPALVHELTIKKNTVAIVTDGTAVLGLGDIGPAAALPVMEGKALLFKKFAGVDALPHLHRRPRGHRPTTASTRSSRRSSASRPCSAASTSRTSPRRSCFEVEERLQAPLDIPVFHDDQHGTAVVALAALENALLIVDKKMADLRVVIAGAGAAGVAISKILIEAGRARRDRRRPQGRHPQGPRPTSTWPRCASPR